VAEFILIP